jgi:hypothetical protein
MNIVGLELNDEGILASLRRDDGDVERIILGESKLDSRWPGFILNNGDGFLIGREAEDLSLVHPRQVDSHFWEELSHSPSALGGEEGFFSFSELAYHSLKAMGDRLSEATGDFDKLVLAVPGSYLETSLGGDEKIGLLLGMIADLGLPLVKIVDMACAGLHAGIGGAVLGDLPVFHVDVHLHSAQITVLSGGGQLKRERFFRIPGLGYSRVMSLLVSAIADRLLRETSFDVSEDRQLEQSLYDRLRAILFFRDKSKEAVIQIQGNMRARQMKLTRDMLRSDLRAFVDPLCSVLEKAVHESGASIGRSCIVLSERASRIRGLEARLWSLGYKNVEKLDEGAASVGAAHLGEQSPFVSDLADVPVVREASVTVDPTKAKSFDPEHFFIRNEQVSSENGVIPSHVVMNGVAYALSKDDGFIIGDGGNGTEVDLKISPDESIVAGLNFRVIREGDVLSVHADGQEDNETEDSGIQVGVGDRLCVPAGDAAVDLLFIHVNSEGR